MRILTLILAFSLLAPFAPPLAAQEAGLTLAQVERKYRRMNEVHILKCDYDGDRTFTRTEMLCVQSIYSSFYLDRN